MLALILTAALSAQSVEAFPVSAPPAQVIPWLTANRDTLVALGGARVIRRNGNTLTVQRDGITVRLRESADVRQDWASYRVTMDTASRKLRSYQTDVTVSPTQSGGTWISLSISASVYGAGERRVSEEIEGVTRRVKGYLQGVFR